MKRLYVLSNARCELCRRCRVWLGRQLAFVPLVFIPLQSPALAERFPGLTRLRPDEEIVVVSDVGEVWQGGAAWVTCLWALREDREWAQRLAYPLLLPLARRACELVSAYRHELSRWLAEDPAERLAHRLSAASADDCARTGDGQPG